MFPSKMKGCGINLHCGSNITKLLESGVLCGNITVFGVAEDPLNPEGEGDPLPHQTK